MKSFSQRKGFKPGAEVIQTDSMNSELRNSLWNVLDIKVWSDGRFEIYAFSETLWFLFFKKPTASRPGSSSTSGSASTTPKGHTRHSMGKPQPRPTAAT